jgi:hypothetical protein
MYEFEYVGTINKRIAAGCSDRRCSDGSADAVTFRRSDKICFEVMRFFSDLCVTASLPFANSGECAVSPDITNRADFAEIMSLKDSRFGRRLEQIH